MAGDDLTAILEHIRDGAESEITHPDDECGVQAGGFCTPHGALVLVAAVERLSELADRWDVTAGRLGTHHSRHRAFKMCADEVREAITTALTGEEAGGEHRGTS
jgi:hypothetical protein